MLKKLVSIVIVLGLAGSASALVVSDTQTWDERTQLGDLGGLEITLWAGAGCAHVHECKRRDKYLG